MSTKQGAGAEQVRAQTTAQEAGAARVEASRAEALHAGATMVGAGAAAGSCAGAPDHEAAPAQPLIATRYRTLVMVAGFASVGTALLLIVMKLVVWLFSGSTTILASLTDSVIDLGASFINLLALRFALAPADKDHRFGHYKAEALASLSQAAFICGSALVLIINGYDRLVKPVPIAYIDVAIYVSIASIVLTIGLTILQGKVCQLTGSEAIAADRFHYLSDVGLNASVILSLVLSKLGYEWSDGLITILLGLYIMKSAYHIAKIAINTLLDRSMEPGDNSKIIRAILSVPGLKSFHDLRTRQAGPQHYIQCHIVLDEQMPLYQAHEIATQVEAAIRQNFPDADITLHMEPDTASTYEDITFVDAQYCAVSPEFYRKREQAAQAAAAVAAGTACAANLPGMRAEVVLGHNDGSQPDASSASAARSGGGAAGAGIGAPAGVAK